ncbi:MAG: FAD-binding oxidoreductase [Candidatus Abyssubacteria bacterium]
MIPQHLKRILRRIVGPNALFDDPATLALYSYDSSLQTGAPQLVALPRTTAQVADVVKTLCTERIPYVARGAGTNLSGGSTAARGGVIIELARMKQILGIDPDSLCARVEPGLTNLELQDALGRHGYFFAPDPASQKVSTLGGNVAENSGGPRCLKYGVTTNHILGLKLVAPDGEVIELGAETLDAPGYDLLGLFVGSEGTLGIATEIVCRILPLPRAVRTMLAIFDSTEHASQTVSDIIAAGIIPATLEMMDNMVLRAVEQALHAGYPTDAAAVLIIEVDGIPEGLEETVGHIERVCRKNSVREVRTATDERERERLWAGRRGAFGAITRLFPNYSVSDGTVPRTRLPEVLRQVAEIGQKYHVPVGNVFHAGDGNLHPLLLFDSRNPDEIDRVHRAGKEILKVCAAAGGTITGEHGVGSEKIGAMPLVFGTNEIELMRSIKNALDPANLCNPGKILPEPVLAPWHDRACESAGNSHASSATYMERPLYLPESTDELCGLVKNLSQNKSAMTALGACTLFPFLPFGGLPDAFIRTTQMKSVVEYEPDNLAVTVQAGLTLGQLQAMLAESGLFLPLDAPPNATLGGIAASAVMGPRRHVYGSVRDLVLGLKFIAASGKPLKAGGKTVKNVAGYDYGKLLLGSWGTLGIIAELTFRLLPLPKRSGALLARFDTAEDAYRAAADIIASGLNPSLASLLDEQTARRLTGLLSLTDLSEAWTTGAHLLVVGAEGADAAVESQLAEMERVCKERLAGIVKPCPHHDSLISALTSLGYPGDAEDASLLVRMNLPPGETLRCLDEIRKVRAGLGVIAHTAIHIAAGVAYVRFAQPKEALLPDIQEKIVRALARLHRTTLTVLGRGTASGKMPFILGNRTSASWLRTIKTCFDPDALMNPMVILGTSYYMVSPM